MLTSLQVNKRIRPDRGKKIANTGKEIALLRTTFTLCQYCPLESVYLTWNSEYCLRHSHIFREIVNIVREMLNIVRERRFFATVFPPLIWNSYGLNSRTIEVIKKEPVNTICFIILKIHRPKAHFVFKVCEISYNVDLPTYDLIYNVYLCKPVYKILPICFKMVNVDSV